MVSAPSAGPTGSSSRLNGPQTPLSSSPRRSDQLSASQSKDKPKGLQDEKAEQLEREFKTRHLGVMGVLAWIL